MIDLKKESSSTSAKKEPEMIDLRRSRLARLLRRSPR